MTRQHSLRKFNLIRYAHILACPILTLMGSASPALSGQFRTYDGYGNNAVNPTWGGSDTQLMRMSPAAYPGDQSGLDMIEAPSRPNPRDVSNMIADQKGLFMPNGHSLSNITWQWGQFLDHDISLTENHPSNGSAPIVLPPDDVLGPRPIPFDRSNYDHSTGDTGANPRQQVNQITAFIDGSQVYGSSQSRALALRTMDGGKLSTSSGDLLPWNAMGLPNHGGANPELFVAGDVRANEQVGLTSMHTLFVREHNRLADLLAAANPTAGDEQLYQMARKIVGAELQAITYTEFLPALLGPLAPNPNDHSYDASVNPSIANEFSTALYRFGHTMLSPDLLMVNSDGSREDSMGLKDAFFNPDFLKDDPRRVGQLLVGLARGQSQELDNILIDDVRNFLFGPPGAGGMDLASLNIQRGRDHGLPDYNTVRQAYGLSPVTDFYEITSDPRLQRTLAGLYGTVDNIDVWVGALAEDHLLGGAMGELAAVALVDQFTRLRDGDRFFYMGDSQLMAEGMQQLVDLEALRLSDIVRWNTNMSEVPDNMFLVPEPVSWLLVINGLLASVFVCGAVKK